ncbi:MAG: hypothetical protein KF767_08800 [Bdellovibrionaceae bacterium]|nr:hypothetical protein [Pseudobdellovibrionaceae bacterium]
MAQQINPWTLLPEIGAPMPEEMQGRGPLLDQVMAPVKAPQSVTAKVRMRTPAMAPTPPVEAEKPQTLIDLIQESISRRDQQAQALWDKANAPAGPQTFSDVNLKPLLALADSWNGTQFAKSYEDPNLNKEKLKQGLMVQAIKADEASANDRLALAKMFSSDAQADRRMDNLEMLTQITGRRADLAAEIAAGKSAKPPNVSGEAWKAAGFARRLQQTDEVLQGLANNGYFGPSRADQARAFLPGEVQTPQYRTYDQSVRNFINATLRRESGAAISDGEFANARQQYLPQPGDSPEVIAQKAANRAQVFQNFKAEGASAFDQIPYVSPTTGKVAERALQQTEMVRVQAPNGQIKLIPRGRLQDALKAGGKQVP